MVTQLLQMAGWKGTGKSTVAAAVARQRPLVVLDHDTTKSALLAAGVPSPPAGAASYEVLFGLAEDVLRQGHSVIIDSPSLYPSIPERGLAIARRLGVGYYFAECICPDQLAESRLDNRDARLSQVADRTDASAIRRDPGRTPHRPEQGAISIDTTTAIDDCVGDIVRYLTGTGVYEPL